MGQNVPFLGRFGPFSRVAPNTIFSLKFRLKIQYWDTTYPKKFLSDSNAKFLIKAFVFVLGGLKVGCSGFRKNSIFVPSSLAGAHQMTARADVF